MADLVVIYNREMNFEECGPCEVILCCRYDSPEAWLVDFETKLLDCRKKYDEHQQVMRAWQDSRPYMSSHKTKHNKVYNEAKLNEWMAKKPPMNEVSFEHAGETFYFWNFYSLTMDGYADEPILPSVYTLNEWFESRVANE